MTQADHLEKAAGITYLATVLGVMALYHIAMATDPNPTPEEAKKYESARRDAAEMAIVALGDEIVKVIKK